MHKFNYNWKLSETNTITAGEQCVLFDEPRYRNFDELSECGSCPKDYKYGKNKPEYLIGMSVPPVMTAQIASRIYEQWKILFTDYQYVKKFYKK